MQQIYEVKVVMLTRGGLIGRKKSVVTTNYEKSEEAIVPGEKTWEGLNDHKSQVND